MNEKKSNDAQVTREYSRTGRPMPPRVAMMLRRKAINAMLLMKKLKKLELI